MVKTEPDSGLPNHPPQLSFLDKQSMFLSSSSLATSASYKVANDKPFPLLQGPDPDVSLLRAFPLPETSSSSNKLVLYDRLTTNPTPPLQVQSSDCALSLLSSPQTSETGLGHHGMPMQLGSIALEPAGSVLAANGGASALHCPGMFHHVGPDGCSNEESHQTLPSHWG